MSGLPSRTVRVFIVDDHPVVRNGLKRLLEETTGMALAGEAASGAELLDRLGTDPCDVVLLDLGLPGMGGLDVLKQIRRIKPRLPVIIFSMQPEEHYATRALKAGASGYLTKESVFDEIVVAVRKVAAGGRYISEAVAERLAAEVDKSAEKAPHERLSDREDQVFRMIARGKSVGEIADELGLSVSTISTVRARVLEKMGMENNAELMRYAFEHGLVE